MADERIKLIGAGIYHVYSRLVLGEFLLEDKKNGSCGGVEVE